MPQQASTVNHPLHYGGEDNVFEAIKIIEAWHLGFCLGNAVKYISRAGKKGADKTREDLEKALWYLQRELEGKGATQPTSPIVLASDVAHIYSPHMGAISADWDLGDNLHICICLIYGSRLVADGRHRLLSAGMFLKKEIERLKEEVLHAAA